MKAQVKIKPKPNRWPPEADRDRPSARLEARRSDGESGESWAEHFRRGGLYERPSCVLLSAEEARLKRKQALIVP